MYINLIRSVLDFNYIWKKSSLGVHTTLQEELLIKRLWELRAILLLYIILKVEKCNIETKVTNCDDERSLPALKRMMITANLFIALTSNFCGPRGSTNAASATKFQNRCNIDQRFVYRDIHYLCELINVRNVIYKSKSSNWIFDSIFMKKYDMFCFNRIIWSFFFFFEKNTKKWVLKNLKNILNFYETKITFKVVKNNWILLNAWSRLLWIKIITILYFKQLPFI